MTVEFKYTDGGEPCFSAEMAGLFNSVEQFVKTSRDGEEAGLRWFLLFPMLSLGLLYKLYSTEAEIL